MGSLARRAIGASQAAAPPPAAALPKRTAGVAWEVAILGSADQWPVRVIELAEACAKERAALLDRLERIAQRLPEIDARLATLAGSDSGEARELESERAGLLGLRREAQAALAKFDGSITPAEAASRSERRARRERNVVARCRSEAESIAHQVGRFEVEGDHRQARLWRVEAIGLRQRIERETN
nr:hypothetical protein [Nitrosomonas nitrosa]